MGAVYVIVGIVGLLWIVFSCYMAYRNRGDKKKSRMWLALAGVGLIPVVLSILHPGAKGDTQVIEVEPHKREVAPTPEEQANLDAEAEGVKDDTQDLREKGEELDEEAEELDAEKERLDTEAAGTDRAIEEIETADNRPADPGSPRKPDPRISDRLRNGG